MATNLTCEVDICEVKAWFGGAAGVCNVTSGECVCPIGFSGKFVLNPSNGCHLSESFKHVIVLLLFSLNLITNMLLLYYVLFVILQIRCLQRTTVLPLLSRPPAVTPNQAFRSMVIRAHKASLRQRVVKRKRLVLLNLFLYLYFTICDLYRTSLMLVVIDVYAERLPITIAWLYGTSSCALMTALYTTAYLHYRSIPNAAALAARVGIRSVYVSYPNLIFLTIHANVVACSVVMLGLTYTYVLGLSIVVDNFTLILSILVAALHWDGIFVYYSIYSLKSVLFKQIIETARNNFALDRLRMARFRIKLFLLFVSVVAVGQTVFAIASATEQRVHFLLFTVLTMLYYVSCIVFGYFLLHDHVRTHHRRRTLRGTESNTSILRKTSNEVVQTITQDSTKAMNDCRPAVVNNLSTVAEVRSPD